MTFRPVYSVFVLALAGCASVQSTMLNRTDSDVFVGNSNGDSECHCQTRPFKGIPITLRVPTHLDVAINEKVYLMSNGGQLARLKTEKRNLLVHATIVETDKVFTVDVKRPASGTVDYGFTFGKNANGYDNSQYFSQITDDIKDTTIKDVAAALHTIAPTLQAFTTAGGMGGPDSFRNQLVTEIRTVAWKRFDLDAVDFEQQVSAFVEQHLNCCNNCLQYTAWNDPDAVAGHSGGSTTTPSPDPVSTPGRTIPPPATGKPGSTPTPNSNPTPNPAPNSAPNNANGKPAQATFLFDAEPPFLAR